MPSPESSGSVRQIDLLDNNISNIWFTPKSFESEKLYRRMGVTLYKRYVPTSGDLVNRYYAHRNRPKPTFAGTYYQGIDLIDRRTRQVELAHILLSVPFLLMIESFARHGNLAPLAVAVMAEVAVNVYPIMLQRMTRLRTQTLKEQRRIRSGLITKE